MGDCFEAVLYAEDCAVRTTRLSPPLFASTASLCTRRGVVNSRECAGRLTYTRARHRPVGLEHGSHARAGLWDGALRGGR